MVKCKMKRKSEEWCGNCGETFNTKFLITNCPCCGKIVISCNNCSMPNGCAGCFKGSKFKEKI